jgi:hypothetical protein
MVIIETAVDLAYPLGRHPHCLVAQIPNHLRRSELGYVVADPERQWATVGSILDLVGGDEGNFKKLHFLMFPEGCLPFARFDDMLARIERQLQPNTVTMFGLEHLRFQTYLELLERFREDNSQALDLVQLDVDSGDVASKPVNVCSIVVKEASGKLRVFLEAKGHPFHGEEFLDKFRDLYQGRHVHLFRNRTSPFNFMVLICLDYLYRDLYSSNIRKIIDHANRLFFSTRQGLDTLFVVQCNPKPEHRSYREVLSGFYGEHIENTPGVRDTTTVFGNCSDETTIEGAAGQGSFGVSSVVIGSRHKLNRVELPEFSTDDFQGAPLCRLHFGTGTRLYYFNLPLHHELDPRSSRIPLKVHAIMRRSADRGLAQDQRRRDRACHSGGPNFRWSGVQLSGVRSRL